MFRSPKRPANRRAARAGSPSTHAASTPASLPCLCPSAPGAPLDRSSIRASRCFASRRGNPRSGFQDRPAAVDLLVSHPSA